MLKGIYRIAQISNIVYSNWGTYPVCEKGHKLKKYLPECPRCGTQVLFHNPKKDIEWFINMIAINPELAVRFLLIANDPDSTKEFKHTLEHTDLSKKKRDDRKMFEAQAAAFRGAQIYLPLLLEVNPDIFKNLSKSDVYCPDCGGKRTEDHAFCPKCGHKF